jgi:TonB family protein
VKRAAALLVLVLFASLPVAGDEGGTQRPDVDAAPRGPSVDERLAEIRRRIQAAVVYPNTAAARQLEGVATVGFLIDRESGLAQEIRVVSSSGHPSLDRAAERSVVRAGELPWVYGHLEVPVRFNLANAR